MRRCGAGILVFVILCSFLGGCSIEKVRAGDGVTPEYTVMKEEDFPEKVKELINENKEKEFQMTYQDQGYLYLLKGYGKQETGGYSIQMVPVASAGYETRIHTPEEWHGKQGREAERTMPGMKFCHRNGFIASFNTKENALAAARFVVAQKN